jgi:hypothetical protein
MFKAGRMAGVVSFFCFAFILNGCATMLAPGADTITIKTIPAGAQVYDGATLLGKTPITHSFKRETFEQKTLTLRLPGYKSQELMLQRSLEKKSLWNFVFFLTTCGATSWGIDALNGNMVMYSPDSYLIDLRKNGAGPRNKDEARWDRIRFAVMNRDNLMKDVAVGNGEYLRAYFETLPISPSTDGYQEFLDRVASRAHDLLSTGDAVDFWCVLENI